ncbi:hypothetical protein K3163_02110 [Qipengyuania sp. 1NDW9]|uniref:hypothetical protein n=1 Tax=Qipengyuania xiapuensis TaxID=2867236 RepID=UPI001C86F948|nr:hypothetical protein [Qipengyuania xiapuensis]MBX7491999.1 hypothetical protein [Qipengyuania xiapuensis]
MRKTLPLALSLAALAAPAPLLAQDADLPSPDLAEEEAKAELAEKFADPEYQRQTALMVRSLAEVLLDLPLSPLMDAMGQAAGEDAPEVAPGTTLRSMAPEAGRIPEEIERNLPRAMESMAALSEAFEAMKPALEDMAERMKEAAPETP